MTHKKQSSIIDMFLRDPRTTKLTDLGKPLLNLHIAVIVLRGKIIASATNRNGSRSSGSGYSDRSIHAEKNVVKQLGDISKLRGADLYVMRIFKDKEKVNSNRLLSSTPCDECRLFLEKCVKEYGLKNVYFTA